MLDLLPHDRNILGLMAVVVKSANIPHEDAVKIGFSVFEMPASYSQSLPVLALPFAKYST